MALNREAIVIKEILNELKTVLNSEKNKDNHCISLYDVAHLIKEKTNELERNKDYFKRIFDSSLENKYDLDSFCCIHDFDYNKMEMFISFFIYDVRYDIIFTKIGETLYIKKGEFFLNDNVFAVLKDNLSKLYDKFIEYGQFSNQSNHRIKPVNSNLLVSVSCFGVSIFKRKNRNYYTKDNDFKLEAPIYSKQYRYECNYSTVINAINGKEDEFFKQIFIKIEDCPEWMRTKIYEIRKNQLIEEQKIEEETKKKQKRLELVRKVLPFLKK